MGPMLGAARYNQGLSGVAGSIYSDEDYGGNDFFSLAKTEFVYEENCDAQDIVDIPQYADNYNESLIDNIHEPEAACDCQNPEKLVKHHKINFFKTIIKCLPHGVPFLADAIKSEGKAIKSIVKRGFLIFKCELQCWKDLIRGRRLTSIVLSSYFIASVLPFVIMVKLSFFMLTTVLRITFFTFKFAMIIVTQICYLALGLVKLISTSANIVKHNLDNTVKNNRYTIVRFFVKSLSLLLFISLKVVAYSMKLPSALLLLLFKIGHALYSGLTPQQPVDSAILDNKIKKMAKIALIIPSICAVMLAGAFTGFIGMGLIAFLSPWLLAIGIAMAGCMGVALLLAGIYVMRRDKHANDEYELFNGDGIIEDLVDPGFSVRFIGVIMNMFGRRNQAEIRADDLMTQLQRRHEDNARVCELLQELEILGDDNKLYPQFMKSEDEAQITFSKSGRRHEIDLLDSISAYLINFSERWVLIAKDNNTFEVYNYSTIVEWLSSGRTVSPQTRAELDILEDLPESASLPVFVAGQVLAGDVLRKYLELVKSRNCAVSAYSS